MNALVMEKISAKEIREKLREQTAVVTFTKANGDSRVMSCTLQESAIDSVTPKAVDPKEPHPTNVTVWDLNSNEWRCFCVDRIQSIDWEKE